LIKSMILCASILSNKSLMEEATMCLFRTSLSSTHSTRMCFTVSGHWQVPGSTTFRYRQRRDAVKSMCNILARLSKTTFWSLVACLCLACCRLLKLTAASNTSGVSKNTLRLEKNRTTTINMTFTDSQHLVIIFSTERLYSILNSRR